ncbi:uncharacterized protein K460DRAFT_375048 [Cucurbitaria berberidis CBS 394.84]|uniref:Uncharacterized protein n=1 Tax=Cucurbitaria berberidis CBS 394.84 TaxID=1168544 RepID=A0A9P4GKR5_9PLEO|nr:uncharacterized protein K460DRAFT_375048 [Cucurbitaria berberidis CBS 394.84]KAF1848133.1 hypothetical protein K460DRAFT_375048 [Cucurbitaria berberidis CBS 394.84]
MCTGYSAPREILLDTTFWEVLPSHYERIKARWNKIARLYKEAKSDLLTTDRDGATNSLKAELEMLENDLVEYRNITRGMDITDVAEIYVTAGKSLYRALQIAKGDFANLEASLKVIEERIAGVRADIVSSPCPCDHVTENLEHILTELDLQVDRVLASLILLRSMDQKYANIADEIEKCEYAGVIRFQVSVLEMDLGVIKLDAELVTDKGISEWVQGTTSGAVKEKREELVMRLSAKLDNLQDRLVETKKKERWL